VDSGTAFAKASRSSRENLAIDSIMEKYLAGKGCLKISMETGMPLSTVFDIVKANVGKAQVKM